MPGAWPNVGSLEGLCTAVLVSPDVVVYAGHCGTNFGSIWLGDDLGIRIGVDAAGKPAVVRKGDGPSLAIDHCSLHPLAGIGTGWDVAFCVLVEPVTDIELVPPIEGCETDEIGVGTATTLVGYGFANTTDTSTVGVKRAVTTPILEIADEATIGTADAGTCRGDSGGPAFVRIDGPREPEWRLFGLLSSGPVGECGLGYYTEMSRVIGWLESETGRDLSPCFSDSGQWAPTQACMRSAIDANGVPSAVSGDPAGYAATCGAPYDPNAPQGDASPEERAGPQPSGCSLKSPAPPSQVAYLTMLSFAGLLRRLRRRR